MEVGISGCYLGRGQGLLCLSVGGRFCSMCACVQISSAFLWVCVWVLYLCTVVALRVVVVLGGQFTVCVFIRRYTVIVMLVIIDAQVQWVWQREKLLIYCIPLSSSLFSSFTHSFFPALLGMLKLTVCWPNLASFSFHILHSLNWCQIRTNPKTYTPYSKCHRSNLIWVMEVVCNRRLRKGEMPRKTH